MNDFIARLETESEIGINSSNLTNNLSNLSEALKLTSNINATELIINYVYIDNFNASIIYEILSNWVILSNLVLSRISLQSEYEIEIISNGILVNSSLERLDLTGSDKVISINKLAFALKACLKMKHLNLSRNYFLEEDQLLLFDSIENLQVLNLNSCRLNFYNTKASNLLINYMKMNNKLLEIQLQSNNFTSSLLKNIILTNNNNIEVINLSNNNLGIQGFNILSDSLVNKIKLKIISLNKIGLEYGDNKCFMKLLNNKNNLKQFQFSDNSLTNKDFINLGENLKNCDLEVIDVMENTFSFNSLEALSENLTKKENLMYFNIKLACMDVKSCKLTSSILVNKMNISYLNFEGCDINDEGFKYLCICMKDKKFDEIYLSSNNISHKGFKYIPLKMEVKDLNLSNNNIMSQGLISLSKLNLNKYTNINMKENSIRSEGVKCLLKSIRKYYMNNIQIEFDDECLSQAYFYKMIPDNVFIEVVKDIYYYLN